MNAQKHKHQQDDAQKQHSQHEHHAHAQHVGPAHDHKKHKDEVEQLNQQISDLTNNWKRALADYQNLEKRFIEEKSAIVDYANSNLLGRVLSVLDNLEMLFNHNQDKTLQMIIKDFRNILKEEDVEEISAQDKDFDLHTMDALETVEGEDGKVVEVVRKGYKFKNKLLRPALVKVGKKPD